jgi:Asp-tRNA(Asn)/Glu-tRNA(Gln) amidotransferase A subunit family amidase
VAVPSHAIWRPSAALQQLARRVVAFFAGHDLLLTPTLARSPLPIGELHGCGEDPLDDLRRSGHFAPFTALFNVTGQPAISVPAGPAPTDCRRRCSWWGGRWPRRELLRSPPSSSRRARRR